MPRSVSCADVRLVSSPVEIRCILGQIGWRPTPAGDAWTLAVD